MTVKDVSPPGSRQAGQAANPAARPANTQRPKSVQQWSVVDVQKWLRRHCGDYYHLYAESFLEQEVCRSGFSVDNHSIVMLSGDWEMFGENE